MVHQLTRGSIAEIIEGGTPEGPVLKIQSMTRITQDTQERYRLCVSDGQLSKNFATLSTRLNGKVASGEIRQNCIIQLIDYSIIYNTEQEVKKVMVIFDLIILQFPVASLRPQPKSMRWTICARVTNKSDKRDWSNSRGMGKLFSVEFIDESGEIRAIGFNPELDKFYDLLEVNKVYYVSNGKLKPANKKYNKLAHKYEINFNLMTEITLCEDNEAVPPIQFSFLPIYEILNVEKDTLVDVIGVCDAFSDVQMVTRRSSMREVKKRNVKLVDDSNAEVTLTLWGTQAENFDGSQYPVMAFKRVKVEEYYGKTLSLLHSFQINPDIMETNRLKVWFDNGGRYQEMNNISNQLGTTETEGMDTNFKTLGEANLQNLGTGEVPDYYTIMASTVLLRKYNCLYRACPSDGCIEKVIEWINGLFRCEKCSHEYNSFKWRFKLSVNLADATDNKWVTCSNDQAETLLGITAHELSEIRESDSDKFDKVFNDATYKEFTLKLRVNMETFNHETTVVALEPLVPVTYNKRLILEINQMVGLI